jgi:hypothetical protein
LEALKYRGGFHKAYGPHGPQKIRSKRKTARRRRAPKRKTKSSEQR